MVGKKLCCTILLFCFLGWLSAQEMIVLNTTPQGAAVYWAGKKLGVTPLSITRQTAGAPDFFGAGNPAFELYFSRDFYETEVESIAWKGKGSSTYTVVLKPLARLPYYDGVYLNDRQLKLQDVIELNLDELARLREEVYAQYGRPIRDQRFAAYFTKTRWYRVNPHYSDAMLTARDKANVKLINDFLDVNPVDEALFAEITKKYEFASADKKYSIRFVDARTCVVNRSDEYVGSVIPYFITAGQKFSFVVAGGRIYIWDSVTINEVVLDLNRKQLVKINRVLDRNWGY